MLHNIGQRCIAETSEMLFWDFHVIAKSSQQKVATYLKECKHRSALDRKIPAHSVRPVHIDDILRPLSTRENGYEEEEIEWLQRTVRYNVSQMSEE